MSARWIGALLALGLAAQWAVPGYLIQRGQSTLAEGTAYRFRTAPVDPIDPFRGRYVTLDFDAARVTVDGAAQRYKQGQRLYAAVLVDDAGDAQLAAPQDKAPDGDYLEVRVQWINDDEVGLLLPFDRYYLDEHLAPEAERVYWERNRQRFGDEALADEPPLLPTYAQVRVRNGYAVLEELFIDGVSVHERLRAEQ